MGVSVVEWCGLVGLECEDDVNEARVGFRSGSLVGSLDTFLSVQVLVF